jgi:hypothetical protein
MKTYLLRIGIAMMVVLSCSVTKLMAYTAVASGNWSSAATWTGGLAPGSTVSGQDIIIPVGITVNLDMNVTFTGLLNTFTVDGTLSDAAPHSLAIDQGPLAGAGTVNIHRLTFGPLLASVTFTGSLTLDEFRNTGSPLFLAAITSIADSIDLEAGTLTISSGGNFTPLNNSTFRINSGTIVTAGGVFNTGNSYNVIYVGASKTSGLELNTVTLNHLYIRLNTNADVLTVGNNVMMNGTLYLETGILDFSARTLTLNGNLSVVAGAMFESDVVSNLEIGGTVSLTSGLTFTPNSSLNNFTIDNAGSGNIKLLSALIIAGNLNLVDGNLSLESGAALTMNAGSIVHVENGFLSQSGGTFAGAATYDVEYMGLSNTSGVELDGAAVNNVTLALSSPTAQIAMGTDVDIAGTFNMSTGKWNLNGNDLTLTGTLDQASNSAFIGNANSELALRLTSTLNDTLYFDASNQSLRKLILDLPALSTVMLGSDLTIASELGLTRGKLDIGAYDLAMQAAAAVVGNSDSNYIVTSGTGRLQMNVNSGSPYVIFPIGTVASYSPSMIQQTATGTSGNFMVRTRNGFLAQGNSGFDYASSGSVVDRTWLIEASSGMTINMNLKLGWMITAEVNGFDRTQAYITHYINSAWDFYPPGAAAAGANGTFELTRTGITALSPFAVADTGLALTAPDLITQTQTGFDMFPNPASSFVNIAIDDPTQDYQFEVIDLTGKTLLQKSHVAGTDYIDISMLSSGLYIMRATQLSSRQASLKRFVKN